MIIFLLPKNAMMEINAMMQRYWWGNHGHVSKIHWIKWDEMGMPESHGGL
jgi:hypothetical protein